jgi:hypothetical protein
LRDISERVDLLGTPRSAHTGIAIARAVCSSD